MKDFQIPLRNCSRCAFWDRHYTGVDKEGIVVGLCGQERERDGSPRYKQTRGSDACLKWLMSTEEKLRGIS